jgi:Lar family restriction alleviation protein
MTELRKCPFCGGEAETYSYYFNEWYIGCRECSCDLGVFDTKEEAIEAWNKRVPPTIKDIEEYI